MTDAVPNVVGRADDPSFMLDLALIARGEPGKGAALSRLIQMAGSNHPQLAEKLRLNRSTVTLWCSEKRWPSAEKLRDALHHLNVDRKLVIQAFGTRLPSWKEFDPKQFMETLESALANKGDAHEREGLIHEFFWEKTVIGQYLRSPNDARAAEFVKDTRKEWLEAERLRSAPKQRNVTPTSQSWIEADTTTSCKSDAESKHNLDAIANTLNPNDSESA